MRVHADGPISFVVAGGPGPGPYRAGERIIIRAGPTGDLRIGDHPHSVRQAVIVPGPPGNVWVAVYHDGEWSHDAQYPGSLRIRPSGSGRLEAVNHLGVEQYVACVVANEVWPGFETEAFRAQAIAARTFVLYQMVRRHSSRFDIAATSAAQVYRGIRADTTGRRAAEAASYTRGIVCTWHHEGEDRLFPTYYSAACGGMSQSAAIFGPADDIEPLAGGVPCDYCQIAPGDTYRWGPLRLPADEVLRRLTTRYPELTSLGRLVRTTAVERTPHGRLVRLRLTGSSGATHELMAERFRLAVGADEMRSTDCEVRVVGTEVVFSDGRGYGHGLGLCQWGAQGQARAGKSAAEILRYYYPGARLTRAY